MTAQSPGLAVQPRPFAEACLNCAAQNYLTREGDSLAGNAMVPVVECAWESFDSSVFAVFGTMAMVASRKCSGQTTDESLGLKASSTAVREKNRTKTPT